MNEDLKKRFLEIEERINTRSIRERGLIFLAFIAVVTVLAVNLLFVPANIEKTRLEVQLKTKTRQFIQMESQIHLLLQAQSRDPDSTNRVRLKQLKVEIRKLNTNLQRFTKGLVSPREMARLVEQVLLQNRRLKVVKLENLPATSLLSNTNSANAANKGGAAQSADLVYKHGMRIQLDGRYIDIMNYLKSLEKMRWKVFWGEVKVSSEQYPISRLTLVIYTLSLHQGWIGI